MPRINSASDEFRIDSHKLIFHPREIARWLEGEEVYPLYVEISPSGACNHRCTFCALDYMEYKPRFLKAGILIERLAEMGSLGIKSIMYGGEGEPLLHREIGEIVVSTKEAGIDAALTTNGVLLSRKLSESILPHMAWIKVSVNAGTAKTYAGIHRTSATDFERVFRNLEDAVHVREETGSKCTIGGQALLLPENSGEMEILAGRLKDTGVDYLVVKPYSQHLKSITEKYRNSDYSGYSDLKEKLNSFNSDGFSVIFRERTMQKKRRTVRGYERCLALPFWSYIDSAGNVWGCSAYLGDETFRYGNIHDETFREIWLGSRRRECMRMVHCDLDPSGCRVNCRMDEINLYLWELTHPSGHVNFI